MNCRASRSASASSMFSSSLKISTWSYWGKSMPNTFFQLNSFTCVWYIIMHLPPMSAMFLPAMSFLVHAARSAFLMSAARSASSILPYM